jgi:hypothetical protein
LSWRCFGHGRGWFLGGVILLTGWAAMPGAAGAFECPAPAAMTRPGVLRERAAQIAALTGVLSDGDAANHVPAIVADLRRRYPGVENAELYAQPGSAG